MAPSRTARVERCIGVAGVMVDVTSAGINARSSAGSHRRGDRGGLRRPLHPARAAATTATCGHRGTAPGGVLPAEPFGGGFTTILGDRCCPSTEGRRAA
jgi:hypothetical protein